MSQKGIGRLVQLGIAREVSRGVTPNIAYWLPQNDFSLDEKVELAEDAQAYGVIENMINMQAVKKWVEGNATLNIGDKTFGLLLYSLFGTDTPATHVGESIVYDHVFTVAESNQHQSLSFAIHDPLAGVDYTHANGMIKKLDFEFELKKFFQAKIDMVGQTGASTTTFTPATTTENHFVPQYMSFKSTTGYALLSSTAVTLVKSLKLSFNQNIEEQEVLGNISPADFLNKEYAVEGQFECIWKNESDAKTAFMSSSGMALQFDIKNKDVVIGTSANPELNIVFPQVFYTELSRPLKVKDLVYQTVKFKATYSISNSFMVKATLTNLVASY